MGKIIIAPRKEEVDGPLVYLAGPVYGAPDWQSDAIGILGMNDGLHIATPRRAIEMNSEFSVEELREQMEWADYFQNVASQSGIIMFWFSRPIAIIKQGGYAHTCRIELGTVLERMKHTTVHVVVGIQEGFVDEQRIKTLLQCHSKHIPVEQTLQGACEKVMMLANTLSR